MTNDSVQAMRIGRLDHAVEACLVMAEIEIGRVPVSEAIPGDATWTPEVPPASQANWATSGATGRTQYLTQTRPRRNS